MAASYNNTGWVYRNMGDYSKVVFYYKCAFHISQRSLPPNHSTLQSVRKSIEFVKNRFLLIQRLIISVSI